MTPSFVDRAARHRWNAYFSEVDGLLALAGADAVELRFDLEAHVADSIAASLVGSELERLDRALSRLGRPMDYLRPLLADKLIERATWTHSPATTARVIFQTVMAGSGRAALALIFGVGYLFLAVFTGMAIMKPLWREHVGVFHNVDGTISVGVVARAEGARELLGWWSIPIALLLAALLFVALTKGLQAVRRRR